MTFEIGDIALYRGIGQVPRLCRIIGKGEEIGAVVYDNDLGKWGYAEQYEPATEEQIAAFEKAEAA